MTTPPNPDDDHGGADPQTDNNCTELLAILTKQQGSIYPGHLANVHHQDQACKRYYVHG